MLKKYFKMYSTLGAVHMRKIISPRGDINSNEIPP